MKKKTTQDERGTGVSSAHGRLTITIYLQREIKINRRWKKGLGVSPFNDRGGGGSQGLCVE